jgi:hypothetical protein
MRQANYMGSAIGVILFFALLSALCVMPARATMMMALELEQLVAQSDVIVVATTLGWKSRWGSRNRIVTDVTLRVEESIKGSYHVNDTLVVTRLGGAIGDLGMRVEGVAVFYKGQKALVFLRHVPALGEYRVVGMSQGVLHFNETDGQMVAGSEDSDLALVQRDSDGELRPIQYSQSKTSPVDEVLAKVRQLVLESYAK